MHHICCDKDITAIEVLQRREASAKCFASHDDDVSMHWMIVFSRHCRWLLYHYRWWCEWQRLDHTSHTVVVDQVGAGVACAKQVPDDMGLFVDHVLGRVCLASMQLDRDCRAECGALGQSAVDSRLSLWRRHIQRVLRSQGSGRDDAHVTCSGVRGRRCSEFCTWWTAGQSGTSIGCAARHCDYRCSAWDARCDGIHIQAGVGGRRSTSVAGWSSHHPWHCAVLGCISCIHS